jgi:hypothetical protein
MADYAPKFSPGASVSYTAAAAITGGQVVYLSAAGTCALTAGRLRRGPRCGVPGRRDR